MKKIISLILVLTMVMALAISASATTVDFGATSGNKTFTNKPDGAIIPPYKAQGDVSVTITPPTTNPVYKVDVVWGDLNFEYSFGTTPEWDPVTHTFTPATDEGWQGATTGEITVTNHSNAKLKVSHILDNAEKNGVSVTAAWDKTELTNADAPAYYNKTDADVATLTVTLDDADIPTVNENFVIGEIIVTIEKI